MTPRNRPRLAVLIDADNIPAKFATAILKEIGTLGELALRRVYGDWSNGQLKGWTEQVHQHGLVAHQNTANTKGKNSSDIGLVIDAMDFLHSGIFDGFVLVSSDSDFTALANRIREHGLNVIGIGESKTPASLRNVCNRFVLLENIVEETPRRNGGAIPNGKRSPQEAVPLIYAAMDKIDPDSDSYKLSGLGSQIMAANTDFDTRSFGFKKLSDLINSLSQFKLHKTETELRVERAG
ncbi:NYN domain-containing protein [uncultured Pelagimonas sp.]|uniref:NYN domain-containing protein n=1 Tax=uncultured Pelagimonas sp. TaxID=1618102 RepID=UPI002606A490|nr:NYN domain-containing protein [uncultured Pelagimonas sp.]